MIEDKDTLCAELLLQEVNNLRLELIVHALLIFPLAVLGFAVIQCEAVLVERKVVCARPAVRDRDLYWRVAWFINTLSFLGLVEV